MQDAPLRSEYHQSTTTHSAQESGRDITRSSVRLPSIRYHHSKKTDRKQTRSVSDIYDSHQQEYMKFRSLDEATRL